MTATNKLVHSYNQYMYTQIPKIVNYLDQFSSHAEFKTFYLLKNVNGYISAPFFFFDLNGNGIFG